MIVILGSMYSHNKHREYETPRDLEFSPLTIIIVDNLFYIFRENSPGVNGMEALGYYLAPNPTKCTKEFVKNLLLKAPSQ